MNSMSCRRAAFAFLFVAGILLVHTSAYADTNAAVSGLVTDPQGRAVVDTAIVLTNVNTGVAYQTKTNGQGIYRVNGLQPGIYRANVAKDGFKSIVKADIELHVQDQLSINFALQLGSVTETITVEAGAPLINTQDASVSTVVDRAFVANVPLNGRSFQDLISMTPGVVTQSPNTSPSGAGSGGDFSVNGQRTESNNYTVDGVSGNVAAGTGFGNLVGQVAASGSVPAGTILGTTQSLVSVDALQEFRAQNSTYSAEYGRGPGGQFSLVTRSGTNDFHGTAFDYLRNDFFDANDWFNDFLRQPISSLRQNDFGGTFGGPILIPGLYDGKGRTFFFVSYEGLRLTLPQAAKSNLLVPDTFMRQQAPAALQPILNAFPVQNGTDFGTASAPSLAQFIQGFSVPSRIDSTSIRADHTFGPKLSLFFRFADTPSSSSSRGLGLSVLTQNSVNTQIYTGGAVSQFSNRAYNDLRVGYTRTDSTQEGTLDNFGGATPIDLAAAMGASSSRGPNLRMQIFVPGAGFSLLADNTAAGNRLRQWNLVDTFSIVEGHHQLKIGVDYRRIVSPATGQGSPFIVPVFSGANQVLNNTPLILAVQNNLSVTPIFNETAVFVQDEWRVTPSLNLSLGLRWEVDPPPHGANGQDAFTLLGSISNPSSLTLAPRGTPLWNTSWYNFAPRLGLAWTARSNPGWETVVRAGGGVYFDTNNQVAMEGFQGVGFSALALYFGASLPATPAQLNVTPSVTPPLADNVYAFPAHLQLPYTLEWNVAIQQAMGQKQAITLSYVGAAARRMGGQQQLLGISTLNPNFSNIVYFTSGLTSDYDALQAQFQRNVSHGIHALASYTWSHCLDSGSNYSSFSTGPGVGVQTAFVRGNCDTDVRHNLQAGLSWDLPRASGNRFARALLNEWGIDGRLIARSSFPVTVLGSQIIDPATGSSFNAALNLVPKQPIYLYGSQYPGDRAINSGAFCDPTLGPCPGSPAPRNFVRGFGAWQVNMAVRREFPIRERLRLQFRAEAFNLLNHPNFGSVDQFLGDATFGQALNMLNQSLGTLASQYQQGGPRSMQFALKFLF